MKNDGDSSNAVYKDLVERYRNLLQMQKASFITIFFDKYNTETAIGTVTDANVEVIDHISTSNLVVVKCSYDFLLGTSSQ